MLRIPISLVLLLLSGCGSLLFGDDFLELSGKRVGTTPPSVGVLTSLTPAPMRVDDLADALAAGDDDLLFASGLDGLEGLRDPASALRDALAVRGTHVVRIASDRPDAAASHVILQRTAARVPVTGAAGGRFTAQGPGAPQSWVQVDLTTSAGLWRWVDLSGWAAEPALAAQQADELLVRALDAPHPALLLGAPPAGSPAAERLAAAGFTAHAGDPRVLLRGSVAAPALVPVPGQADALRWVLRVPAPR